MIDWLNRNAAAVTAIATVILAVLTGVYVMITRQIALSSRDQVRLYVDTQRAIREQARRSLRALAKRLGEALDAGAGALAGAGGPAAVRSGCIGMGNFRY